MVRVISRRHEGLSSRFPGQSGPSLGIDQDPLKKEEPEDDETRKHGQEASTSSVQPCFLRSRQFWKVSDACHHSLHACVLKFDEIQLKFGRNRTEVRMQFHRTSDANLLNDACNFH